MHNVTDLLSDSQKKLLDLVKRNGELTVEEAVDGMDLAETTVRQHFNRLEEVDLLERRSEALGRGRPTAFFRLASAARQLYPSGDLEMLGELLEYLTREGYHRAIDEFFEEFWERRRQDFQRRLEEAAPEDFAGELEVLRQFLDEQGFMPEVDILEDGTVELRETNCPLRGAVEVTRLPCRLEAEFLEQVVGQSLTRAEYIPDGHCACTYRFQPTDESSTE